MSKKKADRFPQEMLYESTNPYNEKLLNHFLDTKKSYGPSYLRNFLLSKRNANKPFHQYTFYNEVYLHVDLIENLKYGLGGIDNFLSHLRARDKYRNN